MGKQRILVVGPAWVGDMVMAHSLFQVLHQQNPQVQIDVLAPASTFPLPARMAEVAETVLMPIGHGKFAPGARYRLGRALREKNYHAAIVLPNSFKSALVPYWAHIPLRTGFRGEMRYGLLNDLRQPDHKNYPLMIERFMALGVAAGDPLPSPYPHPVLQVSETGLQQALEKHGLQAGGRILVLCPGAEFGPSKRWPEKHYARVAAHMVRLGWQVWVMGSKSDLPVAEAIVKLSGEACMNLAGKTTLAEAIDLLSLATATVTNDSGLMHVAAALGRPLVAVYGSTSPGFTPPLHPAAKVVRLSLPCQPCFERICPLRHHQCMEDLAPQQVLAALQEFC